MKATENKTYRAVFFERSALEEDGFVLDEYGRDTTGLRSWRFVHVEKQRVIIIEACYEYGWYVIMNDRRQTLKRWICQSDA